MTHAFPTRRSSDLDQGPEVGAVEELLIRVPPTDQALATEAVLFRVHPTVTDRDGHGPGSNRDLAGDELRDLLVPTGPVVAAVDAYRDPFERDPYADSGACTGTDPPRHPPVISVDGGVPLWSGQHGLHRATDGLGDPLLLFSTQQLQLGQHSSSVCARLGLLVGVLVAVMSTSIARDLVSAPAAIHQRRIESPAAVCGPPEERVRPLALGDPA